ncbi:MAG: MOSC domain-containing protein [Chthoniobacterales bacterium]
MQIQRIFISSGHNYFGHAGGEPDDVPLQEVTQVECVAGNGLRGDRFFDFSKDYKGQITFFSQEIFDQLSAAFPETEKSPGVLRRNVIVSGVTLNELIGQKFEIQGVRFFGTQHCKPCYWMDRAFAPGAEAWLKNKGGLRARILTDGWIKAEAGKLTTAGLR